ncbi:MAG: glycoside hydrolase family 16 protein [Bacteriovoracaceae bacterium]
MRLYTFILTLFFSFAIHAGGPKELIQNINWSELNNMPFSAQLVTLKKHYKVVFFDDFKGKPDNSSESIECFDTMKAQCTIWSSFGGDTFPCDMSHFALTDPGFAPPMKSNFKSALYSLNQNQNLENKTLSEVKSLYAAEVKERWKHVNKCNWTSSILVNHMATDYKDHFSAKFDATQVKVDPAGKGYMVLSARKGKVQENCLFGGTLGNNNHCILRDVSTNVTGPINKYWINSGPDKAGIFYRPENGRCPYGGILETDCKVFSFPRKEVSKMVSYKLSSSSSNTVFVVYDNAQKYACGHTVEYPPGSVDFYPLSCPIMNGGVNSQSSRTETRTRGFINKHGIFEVKLKIPKGLGAFPAAWLMPIKGGWPYSGGEIDIMEARDNANEVYQTYHHGKCIDSVTMTEYVYSPGTDKPMENGDCQKIKNAASIQYSKGVTKNEVNKNEFWSRDHVYSAEWNSNEIKFYLNNSFTNRIADGVFPNGYYFANTVNGLSNANQIPSQLKDFSDTNLPTDPFYWILNHSTWVANDKIGNWSEQHHYIDYVKVYNQCFTSNDYCPCGGNFIEGQGCQYTQKTCPSGVSVENLSANMYRSPCAVDFKKRLCPNGGTEFGPNCQIRTFNLPYVDPAVKYWVDANPNYPGVYYKKINGACPYGVKDTSGVNCQLRVLSQVNPSTINKIVLPGVNYWVDTNPNYPGIYYAKINGACPVGGSKGANCQLHAFASNQVRSNVTYWVDTHPQWPGVYYQKVNGSCPYGGSGGAHCQLMGLSVPNFYVNPKVNYWIDADPRWAGIYYAKINGGCPYGGSGGTNCQLVAFPSPVSPYLVSNVNYWVDSHPDYPGVYYKKINGGCPYGGSGGTNCQLTSFTNDVLEPGITYIVDRDARWPGVYYSPDFR